MNPKNSFYQNTYLYTSNELKKNMLESNPLMLFLTFIDVILTIVYSVYNEINIYVFPGYLIGLIGIWKYRSNFIFAYQIFNMINICMRCYTIFLVNQYFLYFTFIYQFYEMYKFWKFLFELNMLNEDDKNNLRNGWSPHFYDNF